MLVVATALTRISFVHSRPYVEGDDNVSDFNYFCILSVTFRKAFAPAVGLGGDHG